MSEVKARPIDASGASVLLDVGQRIRSKQHPELTGRIGWYEWNKPGVLSAIPYRVEWDDEDMARQVIGGFWWWATDGGVEALP